MTGLRAEQELSIAAEFGCEELICSQDPLTGEREWLAPEGKAFQIQGDTQHFIDYFDSWSCQETENFVGTRLSVRAEKQTRNTGISGTPEAIYPLLVVKGLVSAIHTIRPETLPFDIEGHDRSYQIAVDNLMYTYSMAVGGVANCRLMFVDFVTDQSIALPEKHPDYNHFIKPDELALPEYLTAPTTREALEQEGDLREYILNRLGGIEGYQRHFRRMKAPFRDDPVARSKDLIIPPGKGTQNIVHVTNSIEEALAQDREMLRRIQVKKNREASGAHLKNYKKPATQNT